MWKYKMLPIYQIEQIGRVLNVICVKFNTQSICFHCYLIVLFECLSFTIHLFILLFSHSFIFLFLLKLKWYEYHCSLLFLIDLNQSIKKRITLSFGWMLSFSIQVADTTWRKLSEGNWVMSDDSRWFFYGKYFGHISDSANSEDAGAQMNTGHQICSGPIAFFLNFHYDFL